MGQPYYQKENQNGATGSRLRVNQLLRQNSTAAPEHKVRRFSAKTKAVGVRSWNTKLQTRSTAYCRSWEVSQIPRPTTACTRRGPQSSYTKELSISDCKAKPKIKRWTGRTHAIDR